MSRPEDPDLSGRERESNLFIDAVGQDAPPTGWVELA